MHLHLAVCLLREHVGAYGYDKIGSRVSQLEVFFFSFLLVWTIKKRRKEEEILVCILKMKESAWKKNQSNLIGLLVDSLNYEPHSHVLPYSETHWGQILSSNRI